MITFLASLFIKDRRNYNPAGIWHFKWCSRNWTEYSAFSWQMDCRNGEWFYCYYGRCV